jgi:uncharacterized protein YjlB
MNRLSDDSSTEGSQISWGRPTGPRKPGVAQPSRAASSLRAASLALVSTSTHAAANPKPPGDSAVPNVSPAPSTPAAAAAPSRQKNGNLWSSAAEDVKLARATIEFAKKNAALQARKRDQESAAANALRAAEVEAAARKAEGKARQKAEDDAAAAMERLRALESRLQDEKNARLKAEAAAKTHAQNTLSVVAAFNQSRQPVAASLGENATKESTRLDHSSILQDSSSEGESDDDDAGGVSSDDFTSSVSHSAGSSVLADPRTTASQKTKQDVSQTTPQMPPAKLPPAELPPEDVAAPVAVETKPAATMPQMPPAELPAESIAVPASETKPVELPADTGAVPATEPKPSATDAATDAAPAPPAADAQVISAPKPAAPKAKRKTMSWGLPSIKGMKQRFSFWAPPRGKEEAKKLWAELDADGDGDVTFEEFKAGMTQKLAPKCPSDTELRKMHAQLKEAAQKEIQSRPVAPPLEPVDETEAASAHESDALSASKATADEEAKQAAEQDAKKIEQQQQQQRRRRFPRRKLALHAGGDDTKSSFLPSPPPQHPQHRLLDTTCRRAVGREGAADFAVDFAATERRRYEQNELKRTQLVQEGGGDQNSQAARTAAGASAVLTGNLVIKTELVCCTPKGVPDKVTGGDFGESGQAVGRQGGGYADVLVDDGGGNWWSIDAQAFQGMRGVAEQSVRRFWFARDGDAPNNEELPLLVISGCHASFRCSATHPLESVFRKAFKATRNTGWCDPFVSKTGLPKHEHYHTNAFAAMLVARGGGALQVGGSRRGAVVDVAPGDMLVVPPGVALCQLSASTDIALITYYSTEEPGTVHNRSPRASERLSIAGADEPPGTDPLRYWDLRDLMKKGSSVLTPNKDPLS